jgi:hypothetical protein
MSVDQSARDMPFKAEFAEFEQHKKHLIDMLRMEYDRGPKSKPFDDRGAWHSLRGAAGWIFQRQKESGVRLEQPQRRKEKRVTPARRRKRLDDLANALHNANNLARRAMHDYVRSDLEHGWNLEAGGSSEDGLTLLTRRVDRLTKAVADMAALEAAARKAAGDIYVKRGRPRGTGILSQADILSLIAVYQRSTGQKPSLKAGLFAEFINKFLEAVGRSEETAQDYAVEVLKYLNKRVYKKS